MSAYIWTHASAEDREIIRAFFEAHPVTKDDTKE